MPASVPLGSSGESFVVLTRASRWQVAPRPGTFLPFGSGVHACPGNDLAKLEMVVLVHRLVTNYRYVSRPPPSRPRPAGTRPPAVGKPTGIRHVCALGALPRAVPTRTPRPAAESAVRRVTFHAFSSYSSAFFLLLLVLPLVSCMA